MAGDEQHQVVVTGLGAITPLGGDVSATWSAMLAGKSGIGEIGADWAGVTPVRIAGLAAVEPESVLGRVQCRRMDRYEQLALIAARQAWRHAGAPLVEPERLGVCVGTAVGGLGTITSANDRLHAKGWERMSPYTIPMLMANGAADWIAIELGARAGVHAPVSACASGTEAIGYAMDMIRSGRADVVVAGGAEAALVAFTFAVFTQLRALSYRNVDPGRASRPFDKGRDGFVLGEGAGIVVLESAEHAARRGAVVHAIAAGVGYSADARHLTQPDPDGIGAATAIERALADAGATPDQVVHVNAHATSTGIGDVSEAVAIRRALGRAADRTVVSATKSMTGHLLGGSGGVESIAAICAIRDGVAPPTINLDDLDDEVAATGINIARKPCELPVAPGAVALNNSFGFGGHNVALAFLPACR